MFTGCSGYAVTRRELMKAGAFGAATLMTMPVRDLIAFAGADRMASAEHVILLWMAGGMSHIDTFDPKPGRPTAGEFKPIDSTADAVAVSEILPQMARQMKDASIIRSMTNTEGDHGRATYSVLTSYKQTPQLIHPSLGSVIAHELSQKGDLPSFVSVGGRGLSSGYLGQRCEAYYVGKPGDPDPYTQLPEHITDVRASRRRDLLREMNRAFAEHSPVRSMADVELSYAAADAFMRSPALSAFDVSAEAPAVRAAYGDTQFGRGCLLARRLVEQGVRFVQVSMGGFDTHANNFPAMRQLGAIIDPAVASLISDLRSSGLLDRTLVLMLSEFGRTPRINERAGRDHYPRVFSSMIAGGGVRRGFVYGRSSEDGTEVADKPVTIADLHATVCTALGIDPARYVDTPISRPMKLVDGGSSVDGLFDRVPQIKPDNAKPAKADA